MSDVVDVLEILGADADLAGAGPARLDAMLQCQGVESSLRSVLLADDAGALRALLRAPSIVCSLINPAREEEDEEQESEEQEREEQDEEREEDDGDDEKVEFRNGTQPRW